MTSYPVVRLRRVFPLLALITVAAPQSARRVAIAWHATISPGCKHIITDVRMSPFAFCEDLELRQ